LLLLLLLGLNLLLKLPLLHLEPLLFYISLSPFPRVLQVQKSIHILELISVLLHPSNSHRPVHTFSSSVLDPETSGYVAQRLLVG
jgi:hypothetical protein